MLVVNRYSDLLQRKDTKAAVMKSTWRILTIGAFILWLPFVSHRNVIAQEQAASLNPGQDYSGERSNPVQYAVDFSVVITAPYHTKVLKVWLPLPPSDAGQEIRHSQLSTFPLSVDPQVGTESVYGNKFAYFEFHAPLGAQIIRHRFDAIVWEMRWHVDAAQVASVDNWPPSFTPFFRSVDPLATNDAFRRVLQGITTAGESPAESLFASMVWIDHNMTYDHGHASLRASAEHAFDDRRGHCSDYHGLCATFGRRLGVPTRVVYGLNPFPKESPSHCKLEAFLPPYGWVSFDISETQKLAALIESNDTLSQAEKDRYATAAWKRLENGFRDNTWIALTRGTDYQLVPPASQAVPVVRTIYAEADGVPLPDPDPANPAKREFAWMTVHDYKPDRQVAYPYKDYQSLDSQPQQ